MPAGISPAVGELTSDGTVRQEIEQSGVFVLSIVVERLIDMFVDCLLGGRKEPIEESVKVVFG